jgi:hypothetical protein
MASLSIRRSSALLTSSLLRRSALLPRGRYYSHAKPSVALLDEATLLMSLQHAHVDGPWQSMDRAVQQHFEDHHSHGDSDSQSDSDSDSDNDHENDAPVPTFQVLDLACGLRGEPGTTIAHSLPVRTVLIRVWKAENYVQQYSSLFCQTVLLYYFYYCNHILLSDLTSSCHGSIDRSIDRSINQSINQLTLSIFLLLLLFMLYVCTVCTVLYVIESASPLYGFFGCRHCIRSNRRIIIIIILQPSWFSSSVEPCQIGGRLVRSIPICFQLDACHHLLLWIQSSG